MARIDRVKLRREISVKIQRDPESVAEIKLKSKAFAEEVKEYWATVAWPESAVKGQWPDHPYSRGSYADSLEVKQNRDPETGRYVAGWRVVTNHPIANFIEFGTGPDKPGSRSPWGPYTPTPEFGPAGMTAHHFRGTAP